jgi:hypothetical protein
MARADLPGEPVRRGSRDAQVAAVDAAQMMEGAEGVGAPEARAPWSSSSSTQTKTKTKTKSKTKTKTKSEA